MDIAENYKTAYTATLLFTFLFGALISLLYLPQIKLILPEEWLSPELLIGLIVLISGIFASSYTGLVVLPCSCALLGAVTAFMADGIRIGWVTGDNVWPELVSLLLVVPLHFAICGWGMRFSSYLREAMETQQSGMNCMPAYFVILVGAGVFTALQVLMLI